MNYKQLIFFTAIFLLATPLCGMQPMETDSTDNIEHRGIKRKHDELYTIYQPSSLQELAARSFTKGYTERFMRRSTKKREEDCERFWTKTENTPIVVQELLIHSLDLGWVPSKFGSSPFQSIKFKIFTLLFKTAKTQQSKNIIASFFASEKAANTSFFSSKKTSTYEFISHFASDNKNSELARNIIRNLSNDQSFAIGTLLLDGATTKMEQFLKLGLNVRCHSEKPAQTLLSCAIKLYDLEKIYLLLKYKVSIPMFSLENNIFSLLFCRKRKDIQQNAKQQNQVDKLIEIILTALNKDVTPMVRVKGDDGKVRTSRFLILNRDETRESAMRSPCRQLNHTPLYISQSVAAHFTENPMPIAYEPVART